MGLIIILDRSTTTILSAAFVTTLILLALSIFSIQFSFGQGQSNQATPVPSGNDLTAQKQYNNKVCNQRFPVTGVTSSLSERGNPPANAIDTNLNTRWSSHASKAYIQADLGSVKTICKVSIGWFKGDSRQNSFAISTSLTGINYHNVFKGSSSGDTRQPENYRIHVTDARYIKITVLPNTENSWASITELAVYGLKSPTDPPSGTPLPPPNNPPSTENHAPVVKNITGLSTPQDTSKQIPITVYDADPNDDATIQVVKQPTHGTVDVGSTQNSFRYIPDNGDHGLDNFTYQATDNHGAKSNIAMVGIMVELVNHPPKAENITGIITPEDKPVQITTKVTDPDHGDTVKIIPVTQPKNGSVVVSNNSSTFTYSPNKRYFGDDEFTYQGIDDHGIKSNVAAVSIRVNAPPSVKNLTVFSVQDTPIAISLIGSDPDTSRGDTVSVAIVDRPTHGNVTLDAISSKYVYMPLSNYTGDDSFTYQATDNYGAKSNLGTASITVLPAPKSVPNPPPTTNPPPTNQPENHPPVIRDIARINTTQNTPVTIPISVSDPDQGDAATITNTNSPSHGVITLGSDQASFIYTPNTGFSGSDSFSVQATDKQGAKSSVVTININVIPATSGGGSGGTEVTGEQTDRTGLSFTSNGYTSTYHLYAGGLNWSKSVGLLIYTDGSGEYGLKNPKSSYLLAGNNGMITVAKKNNMVLLTPFSPNKNCSDGSGSCWYLGNPRGYAKWAEGLVTQVQSQYPIDKKRIAFGGYSSGAQLATEWWVPSGAAQRTMDGGVIVGISYGGSPKMTEVAYTPAFKSNVHMNWNVGDQDGAYTNDGEYDVQSGYNYYTSHGFQTSLDVIPGAGHNRSGKFGAIMDAQIAKHVPPPTNVPPPTAADQTGNPPPPPFPFPPPSPPEGASSAAPPPPPPPTDAGIKLPMILPR